MTGSNSPSNQNDSGVRQPVPWLWLILGLIVTVAGCFLAWYIVGTWLLQPPAEPSGASEPSVIILTAPPSPTPAPTSTAAPPTPIPTFTPIPTPDTADAPGELRSGYYAEVANTDDLGLTLRGGPSTRNIVVTVVDEGTVVFILDGPQEAEDFEWWQLRLDNGLEGWAVGNYLIPAAEPQ